MPDMDDIEDLAKGVYRAGRKISGKAYKSYRKSRDANKDRRPKAEIERDRRVRGIRREVRGRIGIIAALPFLCIAPIVLSLVNGQVFNIALAAGAMAAFAYGLFELRQGLAAEADELAAEALSEAPPTKVSGPHKISGLALLSAGMAALALVGDMGLFNAMGMAALTLGAGIFSVGMRGLFGRSERRADQAPKMERDIADSPLGAALHAAHDKLHDLYDSATTIRDEELREKALDVHNAAQSIVDELYEDLNDLPKARRFLVTYLDGAVSMITTYVGQARRGTSDQVDQKLGDTLDTMQQTFVAQLQKLRADDEMDLDVQMDVLDTQMKREGVL